MAGDPPVFIVGCARSGTTLLRDLLRSHPNLFAGAESFFLPWLQALHGDPSSRSAAVTLGKDILLFLQRHRFNTDLCPDDFSHCRSYRQAAELPFLRAAALEGKRRWVDKTPIYVEWIPEILDIFPDAKILHIVRDGRDVAASLIHQHFGANNLYWAARTWERRVLKGLSAGENFGPETVYLLRFEQLVKKTERVMREILEFLGERFDPAVLQRTPLVPSDAVLQARHQWTRQEIELDVNPDHAFKWHRNASVAEKTLFESVAGTTLKALDYEVVGLARHIRWWERAWWTIDDRSRLAWNQLMFGKSLTLELRQALIRARMRFLAAR